MWVAVSWHSQILSLQSGLEEAETMIYSLIAVRYTSSPVDVKRRQWSSYLQITDMSRKVVFLLEVIGVKDSSIL